MKKLIDRKALKKKAAIVTGGKRRWWLLAIGGISAGLTIYMMILYGRDMNNYAAVFGFLAFAAGATASFYYGWQTSEYMHVIGPAGTRRPTKPSKPANSINIYIDKNEDGKHIPGEIVFEHMKKPLGHPHQVINDSKWYYLHYKLPDKDFKPYVLTDMQYFDPTEFGRVLTMPAHKDLFAYNPSLWQSLQPWLIIVGIIIVGVLMVIMAG